MKEMLAGIVLVVGVVCSASANECVKAKSDACGYYEYVVAKSMSDFKAAVAVCVKSSRDTTDAYGLDFGAEYYKACRRTLQGMVDYTNDRMLEYNGCISKFSC